jgi:hypothetical protein
MKVRRFKHRALRNEEWFGFFTSYKNLVNRYGDSNMDIVELFDLFAKLLRDVDRIIQGLRKSSYTKQVEEADKNRDDIFSGFAGVVKNSRKLPGANVQEAAEHLYTLIEGYSANILKGSYFEESSSIYNLLQDLREDKYEADVELLGLEAWVTALDNAEKAFIAVNKKRTNESRDKPKEDLLKYRHEIDTLYVSMINVIDAKLLGEGLGGDVVVDPQSLDYASHDGPIVWDPEKYGNMTYNFVIAWNEVVKKYSNLLSQRSGRRNKDESSDEIEE